MIVTGTRKSTMTTDASDGSRPLSRSLKSAKKRDAIIVAATTILNARTYALATMTEIAAAIDLRDATLYYYFPSKQALFYACHCRSLERFEGFLRGAIGEEGTTGAVKLEGVLGRLIRESARSGPLLYFGDYYHLDVEHRDAIEAWADRLTGMLEQILIEGIRDGSIVSCETRLVVQLLLGMLIWLAKWVPTIKDLTADRLLAAIRAFSLHGLAVGGSPEPMSATTTSFE